MPPKEGLKRKAPPTSNGRQGWDPKRSKVQDSRRILAQSSNKILNDKGELDVGSFVKSREYEIRALEEGMKSSKHGLSTRAFQQVPRQLRRRTASHNVKKIPKRLRVRAAKEIKDDHTPTGSARKKELTSKQHIRREVAQRAARLGAKAREQRKALEKAQAENQTENEDSRSTDKGTGTTAKAPPVHAPQPKKDALARPARPLTKFRKRQKDKTWLPTHMFHAKRAHMTLPAEPLWRFAIPLSPTEKVYRTTHRAATMRGCVAWDMSYVSTIMLEGVEHSLLGLFRRLGVSEKYLSGTKGARWRHGTRSHDSWLRIANSDKALVGKALLIWCADSSESPPTDNKESTSKARRRVLVQIHPAAFLQTWNELLRVGKEQRPQVMVEDLRFHVGSIEIQGPQAAEAIASILHELPNSASSESDLSGINWPTFARTTSPSLPQGAMLSLVLQDPRLRHPPFPVPLHETSDEQVLSIMSQWPGDKNLSSASFFDRDSRHASCVLQSSQKAINRRKGDAGPGELPALSSSDPKIPAILCSTNPAGGRSHQSSWTLLLPWNWVQPFWNSLIYCPLSTGGNPRFGGLDERRQLDFEQNTPWFPADFAGTQAGWNWELREQERRRKDWAKRPKGKRIEWDSIDVGTQKRGEIGRGWACDWEYLFKFERSDDASTAAAVIETDKAPANTADKDIQKKQARDKTRQDKQAVKEVKQVIVPSGITQLLPADLDTPAFTPPENSLLTVRLKLIHRGVPTTCARIYRLPTTDAQLKSEWTALAAVRSGKTRIQHSTKRAQHTSEDGELRYPRVPEAGDLIGFVTTGNFNLGEGQGTGIGCISLAKVWGAVAAGEPRDRGLCIIREAGTSVGRLAEWRPA